MRKRERDGCKTKLGKSPGLRYIEQLKKGLKVAIKVKRRQSILIDFWRLNLF